MRWLTFDKCEHRLDGEYGLDWSSDPPRKFKLVFDGIHVYESGPVVVFNHGARNPSWRNEVQRFGFDFRMPTSLQGYVLTDPNTGLTVSKTALMPTYPYLLHHELGRLYFSSSVRGIQFLSEFAQPIPDDPVSWRVRDKEKEERVRAALAPYMALGETLYAVDKDNGISAMYAMNKFIRAAAEGEDLGSLEDKNVQARCQSFGKYRSQVSGRIEHLCLAKMQAEYLYVKEK